MAQKQKSAGKPDFPLTKKNYIMVIIGFVIILIGFILMMGGGSDDPNVFLEDELFSFRRITLAPMLILFGLIFEIYAIMKKTKED
jgi:hypothetical protein